MICLKCDSEEFVLKNDAEVEQVFRGETFTVKSPVMACRNCGWQALEPSQTDELRRRVADAYRDRHGLLTSVQIKEMRGSLKMSQREFAEFLRVGEASVKRWETWQVQEESSDELMRVKHELKNRDDKQLAQEGTAAPLLAKLQPTAWVTTDPKHYTSWFYEISGSLAIQNPSFNLLSKGLKLSWAGGEPGNSHLLMFRTVEMPQFVQCLPIPVISIGKHAEVHERPPPNNEASIGHVPFQRVLAFGSGARWK